MKEGQELREKMKELIKNAKAFVVHTHSPGLPDREWTQAAPRDAYGEQEYGIEVHVLCGSPSKGGVIADYGYGIVKAFGPRWVCERTYKAWG